MKVDLTPKERKEIQKLINKEWDQPIFCGDEDLLRSIETKLKIKKG